ncbi:MAG: biotin--[acetyl-CoA-carboxylase] ligase [Thermodesulfovibrio sp.]|nr:biotin--[acetyl-CoA-carboxylase] ligase [Thermodesulfovibrio sp.]
MQNNLQACSKEKSTSGYSRKNNGRQCDGRSSNGQKCDSLSKQHSSGRPGKLPRADNGLSADEIRSGLQSRFWREIVCCQSVSSTNDIGLSLPLDLDYEQGETGVVIVADTQEKGRGRFARTWVSPPGLNMYLSIVLKPDITPAEAPCLTILAALASAAALLSETGIRVSVKWPNDLLMGGKKLGGILTEARTLKGVMTRAVIGIGINLNSTAEDLPPEIAGKATSVLIESSTTVSRNRLTTAIMNEFEFRYKKLRAIGVFPLIRELRPLLGCLGREVVVMDGAAKLSGIAEDIDDKGRLVLRLPSGLRKIISSGEISEQGVDRC